MNQREWKFLCPQKQNAFVICKTNPNFKVVWIFRYLDVAAILFWNSNIQTLRCRNLIIIQNIRTMRLLNYLQSNIEITRLQFKCNDPNQSFRGHNVKNLFYLMNKMRLEFQYFINTYINVNSRLAGAGAPSGNAVNRKNI